MPNIFFQGERKFFRGASPPWLRACWSDWKQFVLADRLKTYEQLGTVVLELQYNNPLIKLWRNQEVIVISSRQSIVSDRMSGLGKVNNDLIYGTTKSIQYNTQIQAFKDFFKPTENGFQTSGWEPLLQRV